MPPRFWMRSTSIGNLTLLRSWYMHQASASLGMWPNLQNNLNHANVTLQGLNRDLVPIIESGRKNSFLKAGAQAWTMGRRIRAITNNRRRPQGHHTAFKVRANIIRMQVFFFCCCPCSCLTLLSSQVPRPSPASPSAGDALSIICSNF